MRYVVNVHAEGAGNRRYIVEAASTCDATNAALDALYPDGVARPAWLFTSALAYCESVDSVYPALPSAAETNRVDGECRDNCCERCTFDSARLDELGGGQ